MPDEITVDIRNAPAEELAEALGVDPEIAAQIADLRGIVPFEEAGDLEEVAGLAAENVERIARAAGLPVLPAAPEDAVAGAIQRLSDTLLAQQPPLVRGGTVVRPSGPQVTPFPGGQQPGGGGQQPGGGGQQPGGGGQPGGGQPGAGQPGGGQQPGQQPGGGQQGAIPPGDYILDEQQRQLIRWLPGRAGRYTQNHLGDGYAFSVSVKFDAQGEIVGVKIVSTRPGGKSVNLKKRRKEDIQHIVKRGPLITIITDRRMIVYDGTKPLGRGNPLQTKLS